MVQAKTRIVTCVLALAMIFSASMLFAGGGQELSQLSQPHDVLCAPQGEHRRPSPRDPTIFLSALEPSADLHAANLIAAIRSPLR